MYVYAAQKSFECVFHHHLLLKPHKFLKHIGHVQRVLFLALTGHFGFVSDLTGLRIEPKETGKAAGHLREIYRPSGRRPRGGPCSPWAFSGLLPLGRLLGRIVYGTAGARDMASLQAAAQRLPEIHTQLEALTDRRMAELQMGGMA